MCIYFFHRKLPLPSSSSSSLLSFYSISFLLSALLSFFLFSLLSFFFSPQILSVKDGPGSVNIATRGIESQQRSLMRALPLSAYDMKKIFLESGNGSAIGTLMAAIIRLRDSSDAMTGTNSCHYIILLSFITRTMENNLHLL